MMSQLAHPFDMVDWVTMQGTIYIVVSRLFNF
jgi:hypothetical protein